MKKLKIACVHINKLMDFLESRGWEGDGRLTGILDDADKKINQITNEAISDVINCLESSYLEEANSWANNTMTDANGKGIEVNGGEQKQARVDVSKIKIAIKRLRCVLLRNS